jgi:hypothetical protein
LNDDSLPLVVEIDDDCVRRKGAIVAVDRVVLVTFFYKRHSFIHSSIMLTCVPVDRRKRSPPEIHTIAVGG